MSQAKPVPPVQVKVTKPDRRISESSSKSSTHRTPLSVGKGGSVTFNANEGIPQHRRDSTGQLLLFPIEFGRRRRSYSWQGHPIRKFSSICPSKEIEYFQCTSALMLFM